MSYATLEDLTKALSERVLIDLSDDSDNGVLDLAIIESALASADVEINAYLIESESLPLAPVPSIINKLATDITVFNMYARREGPPDHWQARYDNAIKMLTKFQGGELSLSALSPTTESSNAAQVVSKDQVFSRDTLKNF